MAGWLPASVFLLLSLLLVRTVCSVVGCWLVYLLLLRKQFASEPRANGGLQVILCGFPRSGTLSLTEALRILGFRCLHGMHLSHATSIRCFMKAYKNDNPEDWKKLFEGFTAVSDFPATCSYKQLAQIYPNAKIILNIRDANKWYNSFSSTVLKVIQGEDHMVFKIVPVYTIQYLKSSLCTQFFEGKPEDRDICVKAYLQHIQDVKEHVPPERLLIYDLEKDEGWPELCRFLNVPEPQVPFPKRNDTKDFIAWKKRIGDVYMIVLAAYVVVVACAFIYII